MKEWTITLVEKEITDISKRLGYFPSHQELLSFKRSDLSNKIVKTGGFLYWSDKIKIPRRQSDSDFGWRGEDKFIENYSHKYTFTKNEGARSPYDLIINGTLRVDIKTANYVEYGSCRGWFYRIGKYTQSDAVILYQYDTNNFYIIPWFLTIKTNITISVGGGKYKKFFNNFDLIDDMIRVREKEQRNLTKLL